MKKLLSAILCLCLLSFCFPTFAVLAADDFADLRSTDLYYNAVEYAVNHSLFSGTSATMFSPNVPMTRGMFVTVLCKYSGASRYAVGSAQIAEVINLRAGPGTNYTAMAVLHSGDTATVYGTENGWYKVTANGVSGFIRCDLINVHCGPFSDVSASSYYAGCINWAYESGLVSGTSGSTFSPERSVSREEICAILYKLAEKRGLTLNQTNAQTTFPDSTSINRAFLTAVTAMQRAGVISGRTDGYFYPMNAASRAEVATMLQKFIQDTGTAPAADYSYYGTVPESSAVSDSYFDDACFIGHSIVVGMKTYFNLLGADFYAANGMCTTTMQTYKDFDLPDGGTGTLPDALSQKSYRKAYIMLGVNELSGANYDRQSFYSHMSAVLSLVRQKLPQAKVYLIALSPVTKMESEGSSIYNRENILAYNVLLQQLSREKGVGYLDFFSLFADAEGYMPPDGAAPDGIHPVQSQYAVMKNYIKTHT